jgi:hypothetical protein
MPNLTEVFCANWFYRKLRRGQSRTIMSNSTMASNTGIAKDINEKIILPATISTANAMHATTMSKRTKRTSAIIMNL